MIDTTDQNPMKAEPIGKGEKRKDKVVWLSLVAVVFALVACEEAANLPDVGGSTTVEAPTSIVGRQLVETITDRFNQCVAPVGTVIRYWFVDENTIRGVRDDRSFDYPTRSWSYELTGQQEGRITLNYTNGTGSVLELMFLTPNSGTLEFSDSGGFCNSRGLSSFVIEVT